MAHPISPLDDRYKDEMRDLGDFFSEHALIRYRIKIEVEYLIALAEEKNVPDIAPFSIQNKHELRKLYENFNAHRFEHIKSIEARVAHDVKAVEYYLQKKLEKTPLSRYITFIHFGLTSEDINNLAYTLMWKDGLEKIYIPLLRECVDTLYSFSKLYKNQAILGMTHGQPATPTTLGKEYSIFFVRLQRQLQKLKNHALFGKLNGATGTWGAQTLCYSTCDWMGFSSAFVRSFGLVPNNYTTQVESKDSLAESYQMISRVNTILLDLCHDSWLYISRGLVKQKGGKDEIGSSTMPHKINPIQFENAEGNIGVANALFSFFAEKLPVSRMQRDLSDSTVLRNQGVALGHSLLALKQILRGLARMEADSAQCAIELGGHWEILGEAIQSMLRKHKNLRAYEMVKEKTRGKEMTRENYISMVESLTIPEHDKSRLLALTPETYTGMAGSLVEML